MSIRIKICGITREQDALAAAELGADAIGLVFYAGSPRCVSLSQAQKIIALLPPFVSVVALFVNPQASAVEQVLQNCPIDVLQFHGNETADFCRSFARSYLKAVRMQNRADFLIAAKHYHDARAILVDAFVDGHFGGTGQVFDWSMLPKKTTRPLILSGGLNVDNIEDAIQQVKPLAVDVSSGVEQTHGIKNAAKMAAFIAKVKHANL